MEQRVKSMIVDELVRRGYSTSGKHRVWTIANAQVNYMTEKQAKAFWELENTEDYSKLIEKEKAIKLIKERVDEILEWAKGEPINVVDLGCGSGEIAFELVKELSKELDVVFCPVDTSEFMVKKAAELFKKNGFKVVEGKFCVSDLSEIKKIRNHLNKKANKKNLFLIVGDTINHFEVTDLLQNMRQSMLEKDLLLIEATIYNKDISEKVKMCEKSEYMKKFLDETIERVGFERDEVEYGVRFKNRRIEFFYKVLKPKVLGDERKINFEKGDEIIVFVSYRTRRRNFLSYLNMYFSYTLPIFTKERDCVVALCKK